MNSIKLIVILGGFILSFADVFTVMANTPGKNQLLAEGGQSVDCIVEKIGAFNFIVKTISGEEM